MVGPSRKRIGPKGDLTVTAPIVFGRLHLLPVIGDFLKAFPDINMRLTLGDRNNNLAEDHIDVALRIGALADSNLMALRPWTGQTWRLRQAGLSERLFSAHSSA
ncbi:hypothetical protein BJF92_07910 [Rhizobium rhizosphaerae]|uniref:LysR substrate-binding domain-containing protein n=1 Tax=Xaviernesmea rhizosphaerae TaxID=1672749 RepID=A0A1Q9AK37_9HYPH|nr:hypothetical protein BJF92_07910 [Xaviernesmea rhizosphaerae]